MQWKYNLCKVISSYGGVCPASAYVVMFVPIMEVQSTVDIHISEKSQ